jgi:hypothetical protein
MQIHFDTSGDKDILDSGHTTAGPTASSCRIDEQRNRSSGHVVAEDSVTPMLQ